MGSIGRVTYDARGNVVRFDPVEASDRWRSQMGFTRVDFHADDRGNIVELSFIDDGGRPVRPRPGPAPRILQSYDDRNRLVSWEYRDFDGRLVLDPTSGYARETVTYDSRGQMVERAYFGVDG